MRFGLQTSTPHLGAWRKWQGLWRSLAGLGQKWGPRLGATWVSVAKADRTSTFVWRSNQIWPPFPSMAYAPGESLRRLWAVQAELAWAQVSTVRLGLPKIGAVMRISAHRLWL